MLTWDEFIGFALSATLLWVGGAFAAFRSTEFSKKAFALTCTGLCIYAAFIICFWISLQRPPLRTQGETRLWYSFFLMLCGLLTYRRWHYRWILPLSTLLTLVFVIMNLMNPEQHDRSLMPALQSYWFVPHVTVYIFAYAVFGCAFLLALAGVISTHHRPPDMYRAGLPDLRHAKRCPMGKRSMGIFLELGPERNMGRRHMEHLSALPSPPSLWQAPAPEVERPVIGNRLPVHADVLVWCQLPALGTKQYARIYLTKA